MRIVYFVWSPADSVQETAVAAQHDSLASDFCIRKAVIADFPLPFFLELFPLCGKHFRGHSLKQDSSADDFRFKMEEGADLEPGGANGKEVSVNHTCTALTCNTFMAVIFITGTTERLVGVA